MSSFIVEDKTINRIINYVYWMNSSEINKEFILEKLKSVGISVNNDEEMQKFGEKLIKLNCKAVSQRYDKKINQKAIDEYEFKNIDLVDRTEIQVLKSLQCFLYQCMEGTVPETKLYKVLREIADNIMDSIINKLPEYEKAEWG